MRRHGTRFPPLPNPFDEFYGPNGGAAIQALIDATPANGTLYLPNRIFTLQTLIFRRPITVVLPDTGTEIYGSLSVRPRLLTVDDPGYAQISSGVRAMVQVIDMRQNQIYSWGPILPFMTGQESDMPAVDWQGGYGVIALGPNALMCNSSQMEITRWPAPSAVNEPWTFGQVTTPTSNSIFTDTSMPTWSANNWAGNNKSAVTLYPWYDSALSVPSEAYDYFTSAEISYPSGAPTVNLDYEIPPVATGPFQGYGTLQPDTRFVVQNVLEELLVAGQYYMDVENLLIYLIPPDDDVAHNFRISWCTVPLVQLYADPTGELGSCSGISFVGGPLGLYGCRSNAMIAEERLAGISIANVQAYGIGTDAFFFQQAGPSGDWEIGILVAQWCGGSGIWFGPSGGTPPPVLDQWNSNFGEIYLSQTCQWTRTYRGGAHFNCVGCTIGLITSIQNPCHHLLHDSHDFVVNGGYFDGSFMEAADVGVINSGLDPTIFGTVFNNITIANIPDITVYRTGATTGRTGIYIDNTGCGVTVNNLTIINNASATGYGVYIHGGQGCSVNGVITIACACPPVVIGSTGSDPWDPSSMNPYAITFFQAANTVDPRYQTKYGTAWNELASGTGALLGAPRNNSVLNIFVYTGSTAQPDLNTIGLGVPVNQPQGGVAPAPFPAAPYPRPT